jgi:ubiquinone biosynthesis protein
VKKDPPNETWRPRWQLFRRRRHLKRYRQIISVLTRNGFGLMLEQLGVFGYLRMRRQKGSDRQQAAENARLSIGERLRRSCEMLGPTFVKIGQILSTRPDILSPEVAGELEKLQDAVHPFPYDQVRQVIEEEFGEAVTAAFAAFSEEPLAAASLSQVHRATLPGGQAVVVKVQRPGIRDEIRTDLEILQDLVGFIDKHTHYGELYDFAGMMAELEKTLTAELDFAREGENADRFRKNFQNRERVAVPVVYWVKTTSRVLTLEYVSGLRVTQRDALKAAGIDCTDLGIRLAQTMVCQILEDGFFHADPHPGNVSIRPDGTIVFLDLGMVGQLSAARRKSLTRMFIGIAAQDGHQVVEAIVSLGTMQQRVSLRRFEQEIDRLLEHYLSLPMRELDIGDLLAHIFQLAFVYRVQIPGELTMMAKTLITLQGVLDKLDPELNLLEIMKPLAGRLLGRTATLEEIGHDIQRSAYDYAELLRQTPSFLLGLQHKIEDDDFMFQFDLKNLDKLSKHLDEITNRLSFSIILLAVSIIIAGILIGTSLGASGSDAVNQLNIFILRVGLGVAVVILIGLIISMFRSRRF